MPKTTFILVTVLVGVICGNRLMDNRLLRSSSSAASFVSPYKSIDEIDMNSFNGKIEDDLKLKTLEKAAQAEDLPCSIDLDSDRDLTVRHCNDNIANLLKNPTNYLTYENNDADIINPVKSYPNVAEFDDMFEVEPPALKKNPKSYKLIKPKLNNFPIASYKDFYDDLVVDTAKEEMTKRNGNSLASILGSPPPRGCVFTTLFIIIKLSKN